MKRYTAIAIVIAALVFMYAFTSLFLSPKQPEMRERLASKHRALEKYRSLLETGQGIKLDIAALKKEITALESGISPKMDESLAFARLQSEMLDRAADSGLSITSMKTRETVRYSGYIGLPVEIEAKGDVNALSMMLRSLDEPSSFVSIDRIDVSRPGVRADEDLRIKLNITGLMRS